MHDTLQDLSPSALITAIGASEIAYYLGTLADAIPSIVYRWKRNQRGEMNNPPDQPMGFERVENTAEAGYQPSEPC